MQGIFLDDEGIKPFITEEAYEKVLKKVEKAHDMLEKKNGKGKDMLGWLDLPTHRDEEEILGGVATHRHCSPHGGPHRRHHYKLYGLRPDKHLVQRFDVLQVFLRCCFIFS